MCDMCDWQGYLRKCDSLLERGDGLGRVYDVVEGIQDWINNNEHVTERQAEAIDNIQNVQEEKDTR